MRHPLPLRERINLRLIVLFGALVALCLFGALFDGGHARPAPLGPDWTCAANILGTVCTRNVAATVVKG